MTQPSGATDVEVRLGTPGGEMVAALLRGHRGADEVLPVLRRHRVPAAAVEEIVREVAPALLGDASWQAAVDGEAEHAGRLRRALAATAAALPAGGRRTAVRPSALGPLWMRDIDLLVAAADVAATGEALRAAGFIDLAGLVPRNGPSRAFAALDGGEVLAPVDLTSTLFPGGPPAERALARAIRTQAGELPVVSPSDQLASRAAKMAQSRRVTVRDALELAALLEQAPFAGGGRPLAIALRRCAALQRELGADGAPAAAPRDRLRPNLLRLRAQVRGAGARARSLRRPAPVRISFSGVDGAGKSTQAALLVQNLDRAGVPAAAVWARLGYSGSPALTGAARLAQWILPARHHSAQQRRAAGAVGQKATPTSRRGPVGWLWALAVTADYLRILRMEMLRADAAVVVLDRGLADALVALEEEFGGAVDLGLHRRLVTRWGPRADVAVYLRLGGAAARARKEDSFAAQVLESHSRRYDEVVPALGGTVVTVDAERPRDEIATDIVRRLFEQRRAPWH